jgi:hypothetical protein
MGGSHRHGGSHSVFAEDGLKALESKGLASLSLGYMVSAIVRILVVVGVMLLWGKLLVKKI